MSTEAGIRRIIEHHPPHRLSHEGATSTLSSKIILTNGYEPATTEEG